MFIRDHQKLKSAEGFFTCLKSTTIAKQCSELSTSIEIRTVFLPYKDL